MFLSQLIRKVLKFVFLCRTLELCIIARLSNQSKTKFIKLQGLLVFVN